MSRLPFDPSRAVGSPPPPARSSGAEPISVGALSRLIRGALEDGLPPTLRVVGEISNLSTPNHWYFTLKDEEAVIGCVAWASSARRFGFRPAVGDEVVATGNVGHFPPQGRTQLYVERLEPVGAGALQQRFQALCAALRGEGYFDEARKRPLPVFPRRIAVITSAGGAAVHDVVDTAARRCRAVALLVVNVRVQGDGAAGEIARAIRWVDRHHARLGVDAIIVTRGGGSMEDLWAFNERAVADAAFACSIPLVAAVGHESDTTVIELVADVRAATPTQAAMRLVPEAADLVQQLDHQQRRLTLLVRRRLDLSRERLQAIARHELLRNPRALLDRRRREIDRHAVDLRRTTGARVAHARVGLERLAGRLGAQRPHALVGERRARLAVFADRLRRAVRSGVARGPAVTALERRLHRAALRRVGAAAERVRGLERELAAVDPRRVLRRGYSCTVGPDGRVVRSVEQVGVRDRLRTHVADGTIDSIVSATRSAAEDGVDAERAPEGAPPRSPALRRDQMDLFPPRG